MKEWYEISNISEIDSPCLVIFKDRVAENIQRLVKSIDHPSRLRPHVKTHKSPHVCEMMLSAGITKFKCATIAEAEMLARAGAKDILLAYQPVGPKTERFYELSVAFPNVTFACLIDDITAAADLSREYALSKAKADIFIDLNVGMNRTGINPEAADALIAQCMELPGINVKGLHAYDGHIRDEDYSMRKQRSDTAFAAVISLQQKTRRDHGLELVIVAGGTPTYSVHSQREDIECSPGTFIYWDKGYETILKEQHYLHAAVVISRVISKPSEGVICTDLGHKSIASENPLPQRVFFLNAPSLKPVGHSEEHMVFQTDNERAYNIGDVLYGIPYHVCPTIALYERTAVAGNGKISEWWITTSRDRKLTV
jgi:D-threonine aldolase